MTMRKLVWMHGTGRTGRTEATLRMLVRLAWIPMHGPVPVDGRWWHPATGTPHAVVAPLGPPRQLQEQ